MTFFIIFPDEVVILIFTKLSDSSGYNTLEEDVKSLVQCSAVCKRFDALNSLVPALFISHPSIKLLNKHCPNILNNFNHISSLHVNHFSTTESEPYNNELYYAPFFLWDSVYEPDHYCLLAVSCTHIVKYVPEHPSPMHFNVSKHVKDKLHMSTQADTIDMFGFHHVLLSSIREHKMLDRVVVDNSWNPEQGNLILEGDMLVKLKNCTSTDLVKLSFRTKSGYADTLDIPLTQDLGYAMSNMYFEIVEWWAEAPDQINKDDDEDHIVPRALHFKGSMGVLLKKVFKSLLENRGYSLMTASHMITMDLLKSIK